MAVSHLCRQPYCCIISLSWRKPVCCGQKPFLLTPIFFCCAAAGVSHSDGETRGAEKHSHVDICSAGTKRGVKIGKKTNSVVKNLKINCYWRNTATPSVFILSTIWTKLGLYQEKHPFGGSGLYNSRVEKQSMFRFGNVGQTGWLYTASRETETHRKSERLREMHVQKN